MKKATTEQQAVIGLIRDELLRLLDPNKTRLTLNDRLRMKALLETYLQIST